MVPAGKHVGAGVKQRLRARRIRAVPGRGIFGVYYDYIRSGFPPKQPQTARSAARSEFAHHVAEHKYLHFSHPFQARSS